MAKNIPSFSIIIPTLNEEKYLPNLLIDLKNQTHTSFEVIIIDGHSDDKTVQVAKQLIPDFQSMTIINSTKRNVCYQRNLGASHAQSDWILFMDADNRLPTYYLQGIKYRTEVKNPDFFATFIQPDSDNLTDQAIASIANMYMDLQKNTTKPSVLEAMLGFKSTVFKKLNGFDESVKFAEGAYMGAKAVKMGYKFMIFKDPTYHYSMRRIHKLKTIKTAQTAISLEVARLLNIKISPQTIQKLYPMEGGNLETSSNFIEILLKDIKLELRKDKQFPTFSNIQRRLKHQLDRLLE